MKICSVVHKSFATMAPHIAGLNLSTLFLHKRCPVITLTTWIEVNTSLWINLLPCEPGVVGLISSFTSLVGWDLKAVALFPYDLSCNINQALVPGKLENAFVIRSSICLFLPSNEEPHTQLFFTTNIHVHCGTMWRHVSRWAKVLRVEISFNSYLSI